MRASTTSGSPLPHRQTKASIATLVAFCALAAGAQALAPASAGAMVDQKAGGCFAIPLGEGVIAWRTVHGEPCSPTDGDYLRVAGGGIGDFYDAGDAPDRPDRYAGLNLPDRRDAGGIPGREGQHLGSFPRFRLPKPKGGGGRKSGAPVSNGKKQGTPPKQDTPPKKPRKPLSPHCRQLLAEITNKRRGYVQAFFQAFAAIENKSPEALVEYLKDLAVDFYKGIDATKTVFNNDCLDFLELLN